MAEQQRDPEITKSVACLNNRQLDENVAKTHVLRRMARESYTRTPAPPSGDVQNLRVARHLVVSLELYRDSSVFELRISVLNKPLTF